MKQAVSVILPQVAPTGTETENVADLLEHTSIEFPVEYLRDKSVFITATELRGTPALPGNLLAWIELSPVPSSISTAYWTAIGGGGGAMPPVAPFTLVPVATLNTQALLIAWAVHSVWARLVVQTPIAGSPAADFWIVQAVFLGK